jgi:LysM repeat protein
VVQSGDTIWDVATKFGTTPERVAALNKLAKPEALGVGQKLFIPPPGQ